MSVDIAIVSIGENVEANLIVVMQLINLGIKDLVVKSVNLLHRKILEKIGITRIIDPEKEMAIKVATDEYSIFELNAPKKVFGKSLKELDLRKRFNISI
ncbi:MAG: hypothetical protein U0354_16295 [Candidatus Sericytochromatia bacterium]